MKCSINISQSNFKRLSGFPRSPLLFDIFPPSFIYSKPSISFSLNFFFSFLFFFILNGEKLGMVTIKRVVVKLSSRPHHIRPSLNRYRYPLTCTSPFICFTTLRVSTLEKYKIWSWYSEGKKVWPRKNESRQLPNHAIKMAVVQLSHNLEIKLQPFI